MPFELHFLSRLTVVQAFNERGLPQPDESYFDQAKEFSERICQQGLWKVIECESRREGFCQDHMIAICLAAVVVQHMEDKENQVRRTKMDFLNAAWKAIDKAVTPETESTMLPIEASPFKDTRFPKPKKKAAHLPVSITACFMALVYEYDNIKVPPQAAECFKSCGLSQAEIACLWDLHWKMEKNPKNPKGNELENRYILGLNEGSQLVADGTFGVMRADMGNYVPPCCDLGGTILYPTEGARKIASLPHPHSQSFRDAFEVLRKVQDDESLKNLPLSIEEFRNIGNPWKLQTKPRPRNGAGVWSDGTIKARDYWHQFGAIFMYILFFGVFIFILVVEEAKVEAIALMFLSTHVLYFLSFLHDPEGWVFVFMTGNYHAGDGIGHVGKNRDEVALWCYRHGVNPMSEHFAWTGDRSSGGNVKCDGLKLDDLKDTEVCANIMVTGNGTLARIVQGNGDMGRLERLEGVDVVKVQPQNVTRVGDWVLEEQVAPAVETEKTPLV